MDLDGSRQDKWPRIARTGSRPLWWLALRDHGGRRDRSFAGSGALLPIGELVVSRRRGVGRGRHPLAAARSHLAGIEAADSITCDAHKWFSVPMGAGMFFCRHPDAVRAGLSRRDSSCRENRSPVVDPYTTSVQWSRRFIGLKLFLALAQLGEAGYVEMIEHQARMGDVLRESLTTIPGGGLSITRRCRWCASPATGSTPPSSWRRFMSARSRGCRKSRLGDGAPVLRACITSFRTTEQDIQWVVERNEPAIHQGGADNA